MQLFTLCGQLICTFMNFMRIYREFNVRKLYSNTNLWPIYGVLDLQTVIPFFINYPRIMIHHAQLGLFMTTYHTNNVKLILQDIIIRLNKTTHEKNTGF